MEAQTKEQPVVFAGIQLYADGVAMVDGAKTVKYIPRSDIHNIELRHGFLSQHPMVQIAFGGTVAWLGCTPAKDLLHWLREGGTMVDIYALLTLLVPAGAWIIYDAWKRGYYLIFDSTGGRVRFPFRGRQSDSDVKTFVNKARSALGFDIIDLTEGGSA